MLSHYIRTYYWKVSEHYQMQNCHSNTYIYCRKLSVPQNDDFYKIMKQNRNVCISANYEFNYCWYLDVQCDLMDKIQFSLLTDFMWVSKYYLSNIYNSTFRTRKFKIKHKKQ